MMNPKIRLKMVRMQDALGAKELEGLDLCTGAMEGDLLLTTEKANFPIVEVVVEREKVNQFIRNITEAMGFDE